jgi:hypothetical protein
LTETPPESMSLNFSQMSRHRIRRVCFFYVSKTFLLIVILGLFQFDAFGQDAKEQLQIVAGDIAKKIENKGRKRIVLSSFFDNANRETELGRYMGDKFAVGMEKFNFDITDRSQLEELLRQNKMEAQRILNPATVPQLQKMLGAEVIVTGNYTVFDNYIDITLKAIDLSMGVRIASSEIRVARTPEINALLSPIKKTSPQAELYEMRKEDCQPPGGWFYGKVTFESSLREPLVLYWISSYTHGSYPEAMMTPGTTFTTELIALGTDIGAKNTTFLFHTAEPNEENWRYGKAIVSVEGCKVKLVALSPSNIFLGKTKPTP